MSEYILEMRNITKAFPGVKALDNVNLKVREGEIHSLCGENGAGKSTLMKVLSGCIHTARMREIFCSKRVCQFKNIKQSEDLGIVIIHQELALIPYLSIAENIYLGNERAEKGIMNWNETMIGAKERWIRWDSAKTRTRRSAIGVGKLVEIAKALSKKVKSLILDEPTAALNEDDSENLLELMLEFKKQGISCILISHKLNEVSKVSDSITILRDGQTIETLDMRGGEVNEDRIIRGMVGRDLTNRYPERTPKIGEVILEIKDWTVYHERKQAAK